ncbi:hypothetical protein GTQ48_11945 [Alteromonas genovensis]|uniref:Uncharacterized protein n=1 Tax=Alteromonas genovensis TaxID=471225 RepID=A0A6N9TGH0_9ALTE|nr:hypothetical protein [Alteromonas genovensis]NDW16231.1 hypothetical protein [Alteromonas genovensis]
MAVYCVTRATSLWDDFIFSFVDDVVESINDLDSSKVYSVVKKEVNTKDLQKFCIDNPSQQLVVFYCPPSLVFNNVEKNKNDLNSSVLDSIGIATELLDFFYKYKAQVSLVSLLDFFDTTKIKNIVSPLLANSGAVDFRLSFEDVVGYLAIKSTNDKASRVEYLLNSASVGGTPSVELMVNLARCDLEQKIEELKLKKDENECELLDLKEMLVEKNNALEAANNLLNKKENESVNLSKEAEYERGKLETTVHFLQEQLEATVREKADEESKLKLAYEQNLKNKLQSHKNEIDSLFQEKQKISKKLNASDALIAELNNKLEVVGGEKEELVTALTATQRALEKELLSKNQVVEDSELKTASLVKKYEEGLASLTQSKDKSDAEKSKRNKDFVTLKVKSDRQIEKLSAERKKLEKELKSYQSLYYQLKSELDSIKSSTAWKTISPVIKVKDKVLGNLSRLHQEEIIANVGLLYTSDLFDAEWYLSTYPDVESQKIDPAKHYLLYGFKEGRRPSIRFDGDWYFNYYEDVKDSGFNPLIHYLKYGRAEGRKTSHNLLIKSKE